MTDLREQLREQTRNGVVLLGYLLLAAILFVGVASAWFLFRQGLLRDPRLSVWMKATAFIHYARNPAWHDLLPLAESFFCGIIGPGIYTRYHWQRLGGLMGIGRRAFGIDKLRRGSTLNYGDADWASNQTMAEIFPSKLDNPLGGIAIGELDRIWEGPLAKTEFLGYQPETWGNGGRAPLMLFDLDKGSGHGAMLIPSGVGKTAVATAMNLTYSGPRVVVDPDGEIGPQVRDALEARGLKVVELRLRSRDEMDALRAQGLDPSPVTGGFNAFRSIDRNDPLAQTKIRTVVGRLTKPTSAGSDDKNAIFRQWGKSIVTAILADMMWDSTIPDDEKTPSMLRAAIVLPSDDQRELLHQIYLYSESQMARNIAGTIISQHKETYTSAYGYATEDTVWLETEAYADMVSGDSFDPRELRNGKLAVFLQLPLDAMRETPMIVKAVIGSLTDAIMSCGGNMAAPVWMPIDEAELMDADPSIRTIINQGRKYKAAITLSYQSESQARRVWGNDGWEEIVESLAWRQYAGISSQATGKSVSERLGTFGAMATSQGHNQGKTGQLFTMPSLSSGNQSTTQEMSRELAKPYELFGMRTDERITLYKGQSKPLRHGAALAFRRPEMVRLLEENKFRSTKAFVPFVAAAQ